jgi:hypothetical protein
LGAVIKIIKTIKIMGYLNQTSEEGTNHIVAAGSSLFIYFFFFYFIFFLYFFMMVSFILAHSDLGQINNSFRADLFTIITAGIGSFT